MPSSKRFHGWTKRRFLPFGSDFCGLTPEVALERQRICDHFFILDSCARQWESAVQVWYSKTVRIPGMSTAEPTS
jgi:hypothetical protein